MQIRKFLSAFILAAIFLCLCFSSGCGKEETEGPRTSSLLVYAAADGLYACGEGAEKVLLAKGEHIYSPHISPDGKYVYYNNSNDIFVVPAEGGTSVLAAETARFAGFWDGRLLSYSAALGVRAYDPESGVSETLLPSDGGGYVSSVAFSPNGKKFAACMRTTDVGVDRPKGVYIRDTDLSDMEILTSERICGKSDWLVEPLCWSADGGALVFSCGESGSDRNRLCIVPIVDGESAVMGGSSMQYASGSGIALSEDGKSAAALCFKNDEEQTETVCIIDLTNARCRYIPSGTTGVGGVALSSDGSLAAYTTKGISSGLYVYANETTLCVVGGDGKSEYAAPVFARDSMNIIFVGWGEKLRAETNAEGEAVGTYTETVASVYAAVANSAGSRVLAEGVKFPDGVYTESWADMFDYYSYVPAEAEVSAE
ncbi:MAG: WD40 repeat domain-containing protein [Clostridia bacterium]|nr:WD40 repeat domain-containing protein [Clostridia bacterium]